MTNADMNTLQKWSGLIDLILIFIGAALWSVPVGIVVGVALLIRRWSTAGWGVCILLGQPTPPDWLLWIVPNAAEVGAELGPHVAADDGAEGVDPSIMSSEADESDPQDLVEPPVAGGVKSPQNGVAMPQNDSKRRIVIDRDILELAEVTGDDPREVELAIIMLGRLCSTKRQNKPILGTTDAIKIGLGITPGSGSKKWESASRALKSEIARHNPDSPTFRPLTPDHKPDLSTGQ